jgi:hypothetical protein
MDSQDLSVARALVARHRDAARSQITAADLPIFVLSDVREPARVTGWDGADGAITSIRVLHDSGPDGPVVEVSTSRWAGTATEGVPLHSVLQHHLRQDGTRFSAVTWTETDVEVIVDGRAVGGRMMKAGIRRWAVRCEYDDVEISISARDWRPDAIRVEAVRDVPAFLTRSLPVDAPEFSAASEPLRSPVLAQDPHRALVEVYLALSRQTYEWLADGGTAPEQVPHLSDMWQAAVRRQMDLTDQSEPEARAAVTTIVEQLNNLYHNAEWFREDGQLRERAASETLLFWTELRQDVASGPAQRAWRDLRASSASERASATWRDAWRSWAAAAN